jgi:hypothetical protein
MAEFKPMVKMMTTEPTVELKLKKGGHATMSKSKDGHKSGKKMMDGGVLGALARTPALVGRPAVNAPVRVPGKPSMSARRKAMAAPMMAKTGGEVESKAMHAAEEKRMGKLEKEIKSHEGMSASKAHKGLKTGGVACGQGGYKSGGIIKSEKGETKMNTTKPDRSPAKTGEVKMGNAGGYKTGGVTKSNAGGYKKGGKTKKMAEGGESKKAVDGAKSGTGTVTEVERQIVRKMTPKKPVGSGDVQLNDVTPSGTPLNPEFLKDYLKAPHYKKGGKTHKYATGGSVNDKGHPQLMPQGEKRPARPVSINQLSGTYKKGGSVK